MKKMTRKQREKLALDIQEENAMLKRVKNVIKRETMILAIFLILMIWGRYDTTHPISWISNSAKNVIGIIGLIGTVLFAVLLVLSYISYNNGRKHVLNKIDIYNDKSND